MTRMQKLNLDHRAAPLILALLAGTTVIGLTACDGADSNGTSAVAEGHDHDGQDHDGQDRDGENRDGENHEGGMDGDGHGHGNDVLLGTFAIGELTVEAWQGHGDAAPGKELHLVLAMDPGDDGASVVRTWIGTEDRLRSIVARADYDAADGTYDVHAMTPIPMPEDVRWWLEIERPDGRIISGSIPAN